jgi:phosphoglycerol transferase MdoB-like AlkP superfamily enzyme
MVNEVLLYIGSAVITLWGIAHIIPTKPVVNGFGSISQDNRRIITMEWIAEGLTLCFIGVLVFLVTILTDAQNQAAIIAYRASAVMLVIMAGLTLFTGARTKVIPIKICPFVKTAVAILFLLGSLC